MDQTNKNESEKKLDRWLEAAFAHYSEDEPRVGLEARVLATLGADRRERQQPRWLWRFVAGAVAAMVLIVVIARAPWPTGHEEISPPPRQAATGTTTGTQSRLQSPVVVEATSNRTPDAGSRQRNMQPRVAGEVSTPRLAQFPAPQPLSEQERLLLAFVNTTPPEQLVQDAALQQDLRREVEEARMSGGGILEPRGK